MKVNCKTIKHIECSFFKNNNTVNCGKYWIINQSENILDKISSGKYSDEIELKHIPNYKQQYSLYSFTINDKKRKITANPNLDFSYRIGLHKKENEDFMIYKIQEL